MQARPARRLSQLWYSGGPFLARLPMDVRDQIGGYLAPRDFDSLEAAFCRQGRAAGPPRAARTEGPLTGRAALIRECARRGQFAAPPETALQRLREGRAAQYAVGVGQVVPASYLEMLPMGLLDAYLSQEEATAVERALALGDERGEGFSQASGALEEGPHAPAGPLAARPPARGGPVLSGRQKQARGQNRRNRKRRARAPKPWSRRGPDEW